MSDFFDFDPDCFDKPSPPALKKTPAIVDDAIPDVPDPVFQCPPPEARPGPLGDVFLHIRIVEPLASEGGLVHDDPDNPPRRVPWRHAWEGVEQAANGDWAPTGESGSPDPADDAGAVSLDACRVRPGGDVYLARRVVGSRRVAFSPRRVPFRIRITAEVGENQYAWEEVERNAAGAWVATGATGDAEDPAAEANGRELPEDEDDSTFQAQRNLDGEVIFDAATGDLVETLPGLDPGDPSAPGRIHWCVTPRDGVPPAGGVDLPGTTASLFAADVYRARGSGLELVASAATVRWWYDYSLGPNRRLVLAPGEDGTYDVITNPCPCGARISVYIYGECGGRISPVAGATVDLRTVDVEDRRVATVETDSQGYAHFSEVPAAVYDVVAYKDDCETVHIPEVSALSGSASVEAKLPCASDFGRICVTTHNPTGSMSMRVAGRNPVLVAHLKKTCVDKLPPGDYLVTFDNAVNSMGQPIEVIPQTVTVDCGDVNVSPMQVGDFRFEVMGCAPIPGAEIRVTDPDGATRVILTDDDGWAKYAATVHGWHSYEVTPPHAERFQAYESGDATVGSFEFSQAHARRNFSIHYGAAEGYRCCGVYPQGVKPSPFPMRTRVLVSTAVGSSEVDLANCAVMADIPHILDRCMEDGVEGVICITEGGGVGGVARRPPEWVSKPSCLFIYASLSSVPDPSRDTITANQIGDGRATPYWYRTDDPDPSKGPACNCNQHDYRIPGLDRAYRSPNSCGGSSAYGEPTNFTLNSAFPYSITLHFDDPGNGEWEAERRCREDLGYRPTGNKISTDVTISEVP